MTKLLGKYPLFNRHTNKEDEALVYSPISEKNIEDFENSWLPAMHQKRTALSSQQQMQEANLQDGHWKWREKNNAISKRLDYESYAIECCGQTEGLMLLKTTGFSRESSQKGLPLVYIELISTSPWNRHGFSDNPKYKGVGHLFLGTALSLSVSEGFDGRLGLHSLPQSEGWYRDVCKLSELGPDLNHQGLVYFEFTEIQAKSYLAN